MTLIESIGAYLRTEATTVIAAVSTRTYWPMGKSESVLPYISIRLASSRRIAVGLSGAFQPRESQIEVVCYARTQASAWVLAEAVKTDLDNHIGITPSDGTVKIKHCYCSDESDLISESAFEAGVFAVALTFDIKT